MREAQTRCDAQEFAEWSAYMAIEPWGPIRGDMQAGIIASTIANVNRGKGQRTFRPMDFMPFLKMRKRNQTPEEQQAIFAMWARRTGGNQPRP